MTCSTGNALDQMEPRQADQKMFERHWTRSRRKNQAVDEKIKLSTKKSIRRRKNQAADEKIKLSTKKSIRRRKNQAVDENIKPSTKNQEPSL
jgi:DNA/RNA endonuclease G (NUC1)